MRSTDIKQYLNLKEKEFEEMQSLLIKASVEKTSVLYHKYSYTASALEGKLSRIQRQIKGALNIVEKISSKNWGVDDLIFMEKLAEEEFPCHIAVDSKFLSMKLELIVKKVIDEMGVSSNDVMLKRLSGVKNHLIVNIRRYSDYDYRTDWIRDRYFEIASFMVFKGDFPDMEYTEENSIYDILTYGDKSLEEMKNAGLLFDVLDNRRGIIQNKADRDVFYEVNN